MEFKNAGFRESRCLRRTRNARTKNAFVEVAEFAAVR